MSEDAIIFDRRAVRRLEVKDFPVIVASDIHGGDLYEQGRKTYARPKES